jgi:SnoaL-like domain
MAMDWVHAFFRDVDAFQIEKLDAWFADDINLRFSNNPVINDRKTAILALGGFFGTIAGLHHEVEALVAAGDEAVQQSIVTYTRLDGRRVPLPVSSYLRRNGEGKLNRLWIYIDIHPLYAEAATT